MKYTYSPKGVCSREIILDIDEGGIINDVKFVGGCHGNLQGISALVKGQDAKEVIEKLKNIDCRGRGTSCPAQLAMALKEILG
jgi:uncharacterized protein (TIGR03905 family)